MEMRQMSSMGLLALFLTLGLGLASCSDRTALDPEEPEQSAEVDPAGQGATVPGLVRVRLTPDLADKIGTRALSADDPALRSSDAPMSDLLRSIGAREVRPVFIMEPAYEKRMRQAGLHLWYDIILDESAGESTTLRSASQVADLPGVDLVEQVPLYRTMDEPVFFPLRAYGFDSERDEKDVMPFNDPYLPKQWHYHNTGSGLKSLKGADLNLFEAWKQETGDPSVIVAVIDGGVYYEHEDLAQNIWVNPSPGQGEYKDDIHGYNFADEDANIAYDAHGTHVAGVIAAVNNNGVGVSGVAGGNGSPDTGVRIMVCDAFGRKNGQAFERAFVYAANHGAVIAQNSWGGSKFMSPSLKAAIDYFIDYAGCDADGNQLPDSPMKGGVVLFAAGNESSDDMSYPAAYGPVVTISAMAPDWKKAYYTNRGEWIKLMCPGGDLHYPGGQIYSTSVQKKVDDEGTILAAQSYYEFMQGTSMACPHASGVTGLIVSKYGGPGFTNADCKRRLLSALRPADIDEYNPGFEGILGAGYLDAARALDSDTSKAPAQVKDVEAEPGYTDLTITFPAVADPDDRTASYYVIYYSDKEPLTASTYKSAKSTKVFGLKYNVGDKVSYTSRNLSINQGYHYAIVAVDRWGNEAAPTFFSSSTLDNAAPEVTVEGPKEIRLAGSETARLLLRVADPEGHTWSYTMKGDLLGITAAREEETILVDLSARGSVGKHDFSVVVRDQYGAETEVKISYEVYLNSAPVLSKPITLAYLPIGREQTISLGDYISDPDGHKLTYSVTSSAGQVVSAKLHDGVLSLRGISKGSSTVQIHAVDELGAELYVSLSIRVVADDIVYHVFPIPTYGDLSVVLSGKISTATISVVAGNGSVVHKEEVSVGSEGSTHKMDLSKLAGGKYLLRVEGNNGLKYTRYFVKY